MEFIFNHQNTFVTKTLCIIKKQTKNIVFRNTRDRLKTVTENRIDTDHICTKQKTYGFSEISMAQSYLFDSTVQENLETSEPTHNQTFVQCRSHCTTSG